MKRIALVIAALLGLAATADAQDHGQHRYTQRTDPYGHVFNYLLGLDSEFTPVTVHRGTGFVVGTRIRCNVCGAAGHYSCGANVPLYMTHYSWFMMP
jgi:hypothetical protein